MKRLILSLFTLITCIASVSAQVVTPGYARTIPSLLTYDHVPYLQFIDWNTSTVMIYDLSLNHVKTFSCEDIDHLSMDCYIDEKGIIYEADDTDPYFTQTFFNDDEDWEYVEGSWDVGTPIFTIKKTDGKVLGTFSGDLWNGRYCIINNVVYAITVEYGNGDDRIYKYYTLPEFRKLLFGNAADGVNAVPAMTRVASKEIYDLSGRKTSRNYKGLVVEEGRKRFMK